MNLSERLAEQHIREYDARLKHMDEAARDQSPPPHREPTSGRPRRRARLRRWQEQGVERNGPMGIWDAVAQQLERLLERFER